ncbi:MAG: glucose-6-phosphate 1-dehydrogenase [Paenibacillus sp.]|nr:glucose-6-phosphate 1-dehydrogenase [Paenibacillus sp.]
MMTEVLQVHDSGADRTLFFIFGATGDLARRKLFPAFYSMYREQKLSDKFAVIGLARRPKTNDQFREDVRDSIEEFGRYKSEDGVDWDRFADHFHYMSLDSNKLESFIQLRELADRLDELYNIGGNRLFYLALAPELFGSVSFNLRDGGLLHSPGWHRLVIEKPFGYDLQSAEKLNEQICQVFNEDEVFRIDHYLGKDMVQYIEFVGFG